MAKASTVRALTGQEQSIIKRALKWYIDDSKKAENRRRARQLLRSTLWFPEGMNLGPRLFAADYKILHRALEWYIEDSDNAGNRRAARQLLKELPVLLPYI